jgi:tetratricopeptide (TPR) repeat protein
VTPVAECAPPAEQTPRAWLACGLIALAAVAAYANSLHGAFVFDDRASILDNATLRHFGEPGWLLATPGGGTTAQGRPVLNATLGLNYAIGGADPFGYHVVNLLIHILAGTTLFGVVRRSLPKLAGPPLPTNLPALFAALLWTVHPLQTESVTYVVQRAESLMGLFYLFTLYAFIRATESDRPALWRTACVGSCLLGMGTKEVMVSAPLIVLLYDRTFIAGTFAEAWRRRRGLYLSLGSTWIALAALVVSTGGNRGGSVGFGTGNPWWAYSLTQFEAIDRYLLLCVWPHPLVFEYGLHWVRNPLSALPWAVPVAALAAATLVALRRAPPAGFLGAGFFAILAPSSLAPGTTQMIVEHRMYLPLAAVAVLTVVGTHRRLGRAGLWIWPAAAVVLAFLTALRNEDYRTAETLWRDTIRKVPGNATAHYNLATAIAADPARAAEAVLEFRQAIALSPTDWAAYGGLGNALSAMPGRLPEAIEAYRTALRINPRFAGGYVNLGNALSDLPGSQAEAIDAYRMALRIEPDSVPAHYNLGIALSGAPGGAAEAEAQFRETLRIDPGHARAHNNLGMLLAGSPGREGEAMAEYRAALKIDPGYAEAHNNLANLLAGQNRLPEAVAEFEAALRSNPRYAQVHYNLGVVLLGIPGRESEAVGHIQEALRLRPDFEPARRILEQLQSGSGP